MSNIKQSSWPWDRDKHLALLLEGARPSRCALQGGRGGCPDFPHNPKHPQERGWRISSALPLPMGEQQHPDHSNTAACCSCLSLEGLGRGFQKQPRLKHHPCIRRAAKTPQGSSRHRLVIVPWVSFPFGGESRNGRRIQIVCGTSGPWTR